MVKKIKIKGEELDLSQEDEYRYALIFVLRELIATLRQGIK